MKKIMAAVLALCMIFALCACGSSAPAPTAAPTAAPADEAPQAEAPEAPASVSAKLTAGTGGESGTYYGYTSIISGVLADVTGGNINITVVATGGSKDNLVSMADGMYDVATVQSDVMTYAYDGTNSFADTGALKDFRVLCGLYPETIQIVSTNPDIKTVEDLKGKTVCIGDVGSGTYFNTIDILSAYGMTLDDINVVYQSFGASTESLKDGKIDAAFTTAGAPTPSITELAAAKPIYIVSIDDEHMQTLLADCPWYASITLPAGTYEGQTEDAVTVTVKATLVCSTSVSDEVAYEIVKNIFENAEAITAQHAKGEYLSLEFATEGIAVPFANGAAQYFAEQGVTVKTA